MFVIIKFVWQTQLAYQYWRMAIAASVKCYMITQNIYWEMYRNPRFVKFGIPRKLYNFTL